MRFMPPILPVGCRQPRNTVPMPEQNDIEEDMDANELAFQRAMEAIEGYCELCEKPGHTVRSCPTRDDNDIEEP